MILAATVCGGVSILALTGFFFVAMATEAHGYDRAIHHQTARKNIRLLLINDFEKIKMNGPNIYTVLQHYQQVFVVEH